MTTQDKPAVGPLSAEVLARAKELFQARWPGKSWEGCDVSRSYWRRKARESLAPTAPVEASGSERGDEDPIDVQEIDGRHDVDADDDAKILAYEDAHSTALDLGYPSLTEALEDLDRLKSSRPQPSGETREKVAREVDADVFELIAHYTGIERFDGRTPAEREPEVFKGYPDLKVRRDAAFATADRILALITPADQAKGGEG